MRKTIFTLGLLASLHTATAETTLSTVSGTWYDPAYNGSGFNIAEFSNGLFAYFYGYKSSNSGHAQWLVSKAGIPTPMVVGKTYDIKMMSGFVGNGGTFTAKPNPPHSGTADWGTLKLTFNSCTSGAATLNGKDGRITHNIVKLAGLSGLTCTEKQVGTTSATLKQKVLAKAISVSTNDKGFIEADLGNGIVMIYVPAAKFVMGNNHLTKEKAKNTYSPTPEHQVELSGYWIAKTPTTIGQFRRFVKATKYVTDVEKPEYDGPYVYDFAELGFLPKKGYRWDNAFKDVTAKFPEITVNDQHPVSSVSWYDAQAYAQWLSKKTGLNITLPTEAQWEYAARGNDGRIYPWGNAMPDGTRANYADEVFDRYFPHTGQSIVHRGVNDGFAITSPVGSFPNGASFIGALDMAGNLTEWVEDSEYEYTATPKHNPRHTHNSNIKMQKGGFWAGSAGRDNVSPDEIADGHNIRSDARQGDDPHSADDHLGFRIGIF